MNARARARTHTHTHTHMHMHMHTRLDSTRLHMAHHTRARVPSAQQRCSAAASEQQASSKRALAAAARTRALAAAARTRALAAAAQPLAPRTLPRASTLTAHAFAGARSVLVGSYGYIRRLPAYVAVYTQSARWFIRLHTQQYVCMCVYTLRIYTQEAYPACIYAVCSFIPMRLYTQRAHRFVRLYTQRAHRFVRLCTQQAHPSNASISQYGYIRSRRILASIYAASPASCRGWRACCVCGRAFMRSKPASTILQHPSKASISKCVCICSKRVLHPRTYQPSHVQNHARASTPSRLLGACRPCSSCFCWQIWDAGASAADST